MFHVGMCAMSFAQTEVSSTIDSFHLNDGLENAAVSISIYTSKYNKMHILFIYINIYITILYETQVLILQQTSALCIQTAKDGHLRIRNDVVLSADLFCSHLLAHATLDGTAIPTSILASPGVVYG